MDQIQRIHHQAIQCAKRFHRAESELLSILQQVDARKVFRHLGYASLYVYATRALKLSESSAYAFITVSRKATEIPELKSAIDHGALTVSKAKRITSVIRPDNQQAWIHKASTLSQKDLEREVVKENPKQAVHEGLRPVARDRIELKVGISTHLETQIKRVQDILSQNKNRAVSLEETMEEMTRLFLEKKDPIVKAERISQKKFSNAKECKARGAHRNISQQEVHLLAPKSAQSSELPSVRVMLSASNRRRTIPAHIRHQVQLRDQGKCTLCQSSRWLQFHHKQPFSRGGDHKLENLTTLCWACHQRHHSGFLLKPLRGSNH